MERTCILTLLASAVLLFPAGTTAGQTPQKTTHLGGNPSSMIQLLAEPDASDDVFFEVVHPDGSPGEILARIPEDYVLVVTDINVSRQGKGSPASGRLAGCLVSSNGVRRLCYDFPVPQQEFQQLGLTSGIVFSDIPGVLHDGPRVSTHGTHPSTVIVYGYLVQAK